MSDFLTSLVAVAAVLGFMILIHEFGHYAVAKWLGVRVEQFAIGFGKRLIGFRRGETDYRINAIPLGGYVKMSGENPMDQRSDDPREFMNHSRWHRFLIAIAGPTMNILLAIVLLTTIYMVHYEYPAVYDEPTVIGWVLKDSAAAKAGLQIGDRITRIDDVQNPTWEHVDLKEALNPGQPLDVIIERNGQTFKKLSSRSRWDWITLVMRAGLPKKIHHHHRPSAGYACGKSRLERRRQDSGARRQAVPALAAMVEDWKHERQTDRSLRFCGTGSRRHLRFSRVLRRQAVSHRHRQHAD